MTTPGAEAQRRLVEQRGFTGWRWRGGSGGRWRRCVFLDLAEEHKDLNPDITGPTCLQLPEPDQQLFDFGNGCVPTFPCDNTLAGATIPINLTRPRETSLVTLGAGLVQQIALVGPGGDLIGRIDCLITGDCGGSSGSSATASALPPSAAPSLADLPAWRLTGLVSTEIARSDRQDLVLLAGPTPDSPESDRVYRLDFVSASSVARYEVVRTGSAPLGTSRANVVRSSDDGRSLIVFQEASPDAGASLRVLDLDAFEWSEITVDPAWSARTSAGYVVHDRSLYRLGGHYGAALRGDVTALDVSTGELLPVTAPAEPFPARADPFVAWDSLGRCLVYGGGTDASGAARTDLWSLRVGLTEATLLSRDASPELEAPPLGRGSLVVASGITGQASWWAGGSALRPRPCAGVPDAGSRSRRPARARGRAQ